MLPAPCQGGALRSQAGSCHSHPAQGLLAGSHPLSISNSEPALGRRDECPEAPCCAVLPAQCSAALSPGGGSSVFTPAALATRGAACRATGPSLAPAPGSGPEHVRSAFLCKEVRDLTYRGGPTCGRSWSQALRWASVLKSLSCVTSGHDALVDNHPQSQALGPPAASSEPPLATGKVDVL